MPKIKLTKEFFDDVFKNKTQKIKMFKPTDLKENDAKALQHLMKAGKIINDVSLIQDHHQNLELKKWLKDNNAKDALKFFNMINGVEGLNGIDKNPIEIFEGVKGYKGRNFYPHTLSVSHFHNVLTEMLNAGKTTEVQKILSARTMVVWNNNKELEGIDYVDYFKAYFKKAAKELISASELVSNKDFANYLKLQSEALLKADENLDAAADTAWAELQETDLEFTLGRENYEDEMTLSVFENKELVSLLEKANIEVNPKDMLGVRVGVINKEGTKLLLKFKSEMKSLAFKMPLADTYEQEFLKSEEVKQTMVDVDVTGLFGDYAQCRGGITTAQNLPNNDKLSIKQGAGRRNAYHRQVRQSGDNKTTQKKLNKLVAKDLHQYFNREADHLFVIGHENGHSYGPNSEHQVALGIYKHTIEEHKADVISVAFMKHYAEKGIITKQELKEIYTTWVIFRLFIIAKPQLAQPHRMADLMQFNYLLENGAISFDKKNMLNIDFEKFEPVIDALLEETIKVQLSKSPEVAKEFIDRYSNWGTHNVRIAKELQKLGVKNYKLIVY
ncbi:MAG: hypothetical protein R3Y43_05110 [Alphaproteobacteria bacterium]